jgi:hypothetical protein
MLRLKADKLVTRITAADMSMLLKVTQGITCNSNTDELKTPENDNCNNKCNYGECGNYFLVSGSEELVVFKIAFIDP